MTSPKDSKKEEEAKKAARDREEARVENERRAKARGILQDIVSNAGSFSTSSRALSQEERKVAAERARIKRIEDFTRDGVKSGRVEADVSFSVCCLNLIQTEFESAETLAPKIKAVSGIAAIAAAYPGACGARALQILQDCENKATPLQHNPQLKAEIASAKAKIADAVNQKQTPPKAPPAPGL